MKATERALLWIATAVKARRRARASTRRLAFCTVATRDFVPWALVLFDSLRRHHPGATLVLLYVADELHDASLPAVDGVSVVRTRELVPEEHERDLRRRYNRAELCFTFKAPLLRHVLDRFGERAVYLDCDIDVLAPLDEALIALEWRSVVLTPHLDRPIPMDGCLPSEVTILRAGTFNMGFVGVAESPDARAVLDWWQARVARWGFQLPEAGLQGDQKWGDLAHTMFPAVGALRDPGSNVGSWNLHSRHVARREGRLEANGAPLAFFHFSGFDPDRPQVLSKYQNRIDEASVPVVMELARDFAGRIVAARARAASLAWSAAGAVPASSSTTHAGGPMPEEAYRCRIEAPQPEGVYETVEELEFVASVTNTSAHPWPVAASPEGHGGIALTWHLRGHDKQVLVFDNPRFALPRDVAPGETVAVRLGVRLPGQPGRYLVELDLLHEGVAWFAEKGNESFWLYVRVGVFDPRAAP